MKTKRNTKARRLAAAVKHYFTTYENADKKPGWCVRVRNARESVFAIIDEIEAE